jgi:dTDP-4-dehydrorhamnose reductase
MSVGNSREGRLELWGGVECTVNRVGDVYFDQLERNGHARRVEDLDLFAGLGIEAIRYPVLWERTAPGGLEEADWSWPDERLGRLRELGVRPVVGLVHHGSGPRHTSLVDPEFPRKLAEYARAVAERYPWVDAYTPVNEPLTTARFSGLYGHWYPHGRDDRTFARALVTQCRAVSLSMRAAREVNPAAQLIQTEDLGKTYSTPRLRYQAALENERRWLSFDLLTGRLTGGHPFRAYLTRAGVTESELDWFEENPCPPDVVGINHYLTSERFLDERTGRYPACYHGGNGRDAYADVEAVRVLPEELAGHRALLREAWERYRLPVALTEVHLCSTREEQLRWFRQAWDASARLREEGVDVRAVTAWSLLGAFDWNRLVTCADGFYEPGVFDVSGPRPRPTALAAMLRSLAEGREYENPAAEGPGWWQKLNRLFYPAGRRRAGVPALSGGRGGGPSAGRSSTRPLLITGAAGRLGRAFARACEARGISYRALCRSELDIADYNSVRAALDKYAPWAVVNAAGYACPDAAEREPDACFRENTDGAAVLSAACARGGAALLTFSTDLVFDGVAARPYVETDAPSPPGVYGRSKAEAERVVLATHPSALVVRSGPLFGNWDERDFVAAALRALAAGEEFDADDERVVSPTYAEDMVNAALDLLIDGECGVWHLANAGAGTRAELARRAARLAGHDGKRLEVTVAGRKGPPSPRLAFALGSERGRLLPELDEALARYLKECPAGWGGEGKTQAAAGAGRRERPADLKRRSAVAAGGTRGVLVKDAFSGQENQNHQA